MLSGFLITSCILASIAPFYLWWKKNLRFYKLARKIPGGGSSAILGDIKEAISFNYDPTRLILSKAAVDGKDGILKLWRGPDLFVAISEPSFMQTYFNDNALQKRADFYDAFDPWIGKDNILSAEHDVWKQVRKMMVHTFSAMSPNDLTKAMSTEGRLFVDRVAKYADGDWFECEEIISRTSNALFGKLAMNEDVNDYEELTDNLLECPTLTRGIVLRVVSIPHYLNLTYPFTKNGRDFTRITTKINKNMLQILTKKRAIYDEYVREGKEIPNLYVYNIFEKYPKLSMEDVTNQVVTMFGAGVDTTITSIGYSLTMLAMHPEIQERVFQEDAEIQARLAGRELEAQDLQDYEYLERVIKETLRLYPVFPLIGRVARSEVKMGKYIIPEGATCVLCYFWAHRRADLFPNPTKFDPERHLPENVQKMHPYTFQPFSAGSKTCIGSKFAMMSMKVILATFIRNYKVYSPYKSIDEVDKNTLATVTLEDKSKFRMRLERRS